MENESPQISVVVPVYNEQEVISTTLDRIFSIMESNSFIFEVIIVNDGSRDRTLEILQQELEVRTPNLRLIQLPRNRGHMAALTAGLEASRGEYIVTIDADLQDPPEYIPEMFQIMKKSRREDRNPIEVVQTVRSDRQSDTLFKRISAKYYYRFISKLLDMPITSNAADYRMMTRKVVEQLVALEERQRVYRLIIPWLGFRTHNLEIIRHERFSGTSKYNLGAMISLALESTISFTWKPLHLIAQIGLIASIVSMLFAFVTFILWFFTSTVPGWTSLFLLMLTANCFLFFAIGMLGEYVGRTYEQVLKRPISSWYEIV